METFERLINKLIKNDFQFSKSDKTIVNNAIKYIVIHQYPYLDANLKKIFVNAMAIAKMPEKTTTDLINNIKKCLIIKDYKSIGGLFSGLNASGIKRKPKTKTKPKFKSKSKTKKRKTRQYGGNGKCSICLDDLSEHSNGVPITLHTVETKPGTIIEHKFHLNCIANWFNNHNTCPICRDEIIHIPDALQTKLAQSQRQSQNQGDDYTVFNMFGTIIILGIAVFIYSTFSFATSSFDASAPYSYYLSNGTLNPDYDQYALDPYYHNGENVFFPYYIYNALVNNTLG